MSKRARFLIPLLVLAACKSSNSSPAAPGGSGGPGVRPGVVASEGVLDPREQAVSRLVSRMLEHEHLRHHPLDDDVSTKAFERYLERLDPGKLFLLSEQIGALREHARSMDDEMREGRLRLAHAGAALMARRLEVVAMMVEHRLAQPFDFTARESMETDAEKLAFASTDAELAERWRKVLKLDVLHRVVRMEEIAKARAEAKAKGEQAGADPGGEPGGDQAVVSSAAEIPATFEGREAKARADLSKSYAGRFARLSQREPLDHIEMFVNAVADVYDPHTAYLPPVDKENFDIEMSGSLEGIGAVLIEDDQYIKVTQVVAGSASWRDGRLEVNDLILAVAQDGEDAVDVANMRLNKVVQLIRGPKGTVVGLTIQKPDGRVLEIALTRDVVQIEAAYAKGAILTHPKLERRVGYIELPSFYGNTRANPGQTVERDCTDDVAALLDRFTRSGVNQVVLDLRSNGGGLLQDAQEMSGLFIESGPIVQTRDSEGERDVLSDDDDGIAFDGHLVVMIDRFSASASEILAGALQDYRRAVIVGTGPSHGKGTVQILLSLDALAGEAGGDLGVVKLTRQQFFRITGSSTQRRGVEPDVALPDPTAHVESGERYLDFALPWNSVEALRYRPWPGGVGNVSALSTASRARQGSNPVFARVRKYSEFLARDGEHTLEPLALTEWRALREQRQQAAKGITEDLEKQPARMTVALIDYDGLAAVEPTARPGAKGPRKSAFERWRERIARDPWLEETLFIVADMAGAR